MNFNFVKFTENTEHSPSPLWTKIVGWTLISAGFLKSAVAGFLMGKHMSPYFPKPWYFDLFNADTFITLGVFILLQHIVRKKYPKLFWTGLAGCTLLLLMPLGDVYAKHTKDLNSSLIECQKMADRGELKPGITPETCAKQINK